MKTKRIVLIVILILIPILILTNPSKESHISAVTKSAENVFGKELIDSLQNNLVGGVKEFLGKDGLKNLEDIFGENNVEQAEEYIRNNKPAIAQLVTRKNYFLFSLTQVEIAGIQQTIGIGILGSVYILI